LRPSAGGSSATCTTARSSSSSPCGSSSSSHARTRTATRTNLDRALDELRSIAHGIYPPVLAEQGLVAALLDAARQSPLAVVVTTEPIPDLPEEAETAAYFSCLEALQNAAKHAGREARCRVRVWSEASMLRFEVTDDGRGFTPSRRGRGEGLTNMADRVAGLGGSLTIHSQPGDGTLVAGAIPLRPAPSSRA
jgi:signal transduction histidine kinase